MSNQKMSRYPIEIKELSRGWQAGLTSRNKKAPAEVLPLFIEGWNGAKEFLATQGRTHVKKSYMHDDAYEDFVTAEIEAFHALRGDVKGAFVARGY